MQTGKPNKLYFPCVISWPVISPSTTENRANFAGCDYKLFSFLLLYFLFYLLLKMPIFSRFFFFFGQTHFLSFYIPLPRSIPLGGDVAVGFLLFCNEGSWCCQQCLAASPALLFYSGPAKNIWSPGAKTLHPVSHRSFTADSRQPLLKMFPFFMTNRSMLLETINSQIFHFTFSPSIRNQIMPPTFNLLMRRQQF